MNASTVDAGLVLFLLVALGGVAVFAYALWYWENR